MAPENSTDSEISSNPYNGDPLVITNNDSSNMKLVNVLFNGTNFQRWSRAVKLALISRMKLGFITGGVPKPVNDQVKLDQWLRCDSLVMSWLLHSMEPELADAFLYADSAKELWNELCERFGQSNGPLLFQIEKDIAEVTQGNDSVAIYYTKLKKHWDELLSLSDIPACTCGAMKKVLEFDQQQKLMKFLMNLNDGYDNVRSQLLLMDPLASVSRSYSFVQQVEKQKQITANVPHITELSAYANSKEFNVGKGSDSTICMVNKGGNRSGFEVVNRKDYKKAKGQRFCEFGKEKGHVKDTCFKLHGYPDWYKPNNQGGSSKKGFKLASNVVSEGISYDDIPATPLDEGGDFGSGSSKGTGQLDHGFVNAVAQEMMKLMKDKQSSDGSDRSRFAGNAFTNFAGPYQ